MELPEFSQTASESIKLYKHFGKQIVKHIPIHDIRHESQKPYGKKKSAKHKSIFYLIPSV